MEVKDRPSLGRRSGLLVFSNGIVLLAVLAAVLIYVFNANTNALIQLLAGRYAGARWIIGGHSAGGCGGETGWVRVEGRPGPRRPSIGWFVSEVGGCRLPGGIPASGIGTADPSCLGHRPRVCRRINGRSVATWCRPRAQSAGRRGTGSRGTAPAQSHRREGGASGVGWWWRA